MTIISPRGQKQEKQIEHEINDPASFLPTTLHHQGDNFLRTKPAYATYNRTPVNRETIDSSFLCDKEKFTPPPPPPTWRESLSVNSSQDIRETTLLNASWQLQCSTTGAITNMMKINLQPKWSGHGNQHVTNSSKTLTSPQAGTSLPSTSCTPISAWQECEISSHLPKIYNPKKASSGENNSNTETKCSRHGKDYTSTPQFPDIHLSQNVFGSTSIFISMTESSPKCGMTSSQGPNLSKMGENLLKP